MHILSQSCQTSAISVKEFFRKYLTLGVILKGNIMLVADIAFDYHPKGHFFGSTLIHNVSNMFLLSTFSIKYFCTFWARWNLGPYLVYCKLKIRTISKFSVIAHFRVSYATDKVLAETGGKIEKGETVAALRKLEVEHCLWMLTCGDGMGKFQWR